MRTQTLHGWTLAAAVATCLGLAGCADSTCTAGPSPLCVCGPGHQGTAVCTASGELDRCLCPAPDGGSGGTGGEQDAGTSSDAGTSDGGTVPDAGP